MFGEAEASPDTAIPGTEESEQWDPGGFQDYRDSLASNYKRTLHEIMPISKGRSPMVREAQLFSGFQDIHVNKMTLDTGASSASYIGRSLVNRFHNLVTNPCRQSARLGDGKTIVEISESCTLQVKPLNNSGKVVGVFPTEFLIVEGLGDEIIIGLPDLLGHYFEYFEAVLELAAKASGKKFLSLAKELGQDCVASLLDQLCDSLEDELYTQSPDLDKLASLVKIAKRRSFFCSARDAVCLNVRMNAIEEIVSVAEKCNPGDLVYPWDNLDEKCEEEESTPDPLSFNEDVLRFMETPIEVSRQEYLDSLPDHISKEWMEHNPKILQLLRKVSCIDLFAPTAWNGLKIDPVKLETVGVLPTRLSPQARPVRSELFENAKKEFDRLLKYFYELSTSSIASPLVIAAKATAPFLRFCGDYRVVNKYIKIPQTPIPIPVHELQKAAKFHVFVDIDMANSFHQIPLSPEFSDLLSVKTPWGLVRPKFLPEGVGPASGLLQDIVRTIFHDFEDWTVVIFDNFLICADNYDDAYEKLEKVIERCSEFGVVLKLKKSWFGVKEVNFFGYVVTHGKWRMSDERKAAISDMVFPNTTKQMQSFLGAALFFHHHIPDYSEWTSRLYEMTHIGFAWDPGKWTYDYKGHFDKFKAHITKAVELFFPDYSLPWIVRCDASEHAVGACLYQEFTGPKNVLIHQPICFC